MGHASAFPKDGLHRVAFRGHRALEPVGFRRAVLLMDDRFGGDEPPGVYHRTAEDTPERCAPESLEVVGRVALQGLLDAAALFEIVDARAGLRPRAVPPPETAGGAEASDGALAAQEVPADDRKTAEGSDGPR
jgi:hypothetical protein